MLLHERRLIAAYAGTAAPSRMNAAFRIKIMIG